jgi:hypothetical protein
MEPGTLATDGSDAHPDPALETTTETADPEPASEPLTLKGSFGTAVGAAMLGFEQALRDGPPPQIQAAEHLPDRRTTSGEDGLVIEFPGPPSTTDEDDG